MARVVGMNKALSKHVHWLAARKYTQNMPGNIKLHTQRMNKSMADSIDVYRLGLT